MAEKDTELMAQTLNVKVWVLGEWEVDRAGVTRIKPECLPGARFKA